MKILHVLPALTKGGAERVAADLANAAVAAGHAVTVLAAYPSDPGLLRDSLSPDIPVRFIQSAPGGQYRAALSWIPRQWAWLSSQDVIHCHMTFAAYFGSLCWMMRGLRQTKGPAIVETIHSVGMKVTRANAVLHPKLAAHRDGVVLMAEDDVWPAFIARQPKIISAVIPNGVAAPKGPASKADATAYRKAAGIPDDALVIGTVGQLRADRQPGLMVEVFERIVRAMGDKVHLLMAGEGDYRPILTELIAAKGLQDRVHLPGVAPGARLPASVMDLYLTLNVGQITGIAALEAAFAGAPLIAIQLNAGHVLGPGDWIWSDPNPAKVAAKAVELLSSPKARVDLAKAQGAHVQARHSVDGMARAYDQFYQKVLESRGRTSA